MLNLGRRKLGISIYFSLVTQTALDVRLISLFIELLVNDILIQYNTYSIVRISLVCIPVYTHAELNN